MSDATAPTASLDVDVYDLDGESVGTRTLPTDWFGGEVNVPLVHQVVTAQLANARTGSAQTKTRSTIRGGGRKPWRQKGTGRARHGSIRSPIWVGGAVAHGRSSKENHSQRVNKKMKRLALRSALSDLARTGDITVVADLTFPQPKTKRAVELLARLGRDDVQRVLVVLASNDRSTVKSFRNIAGAHIVVVDQLTTYDAVRADVVVFEDRALELIGTGKRGDLPAPVIQDAAADEDAPDEDAPEETTTADEDEEPLAVDDEPASDETESSTDDVEDELDEPVDEPVDDQEDDEA